MKLNHHTYGKGINSGCLEFVNWRQVLFLSGYEQRFKEPGSICYINIQSTLPLTTSAPPPPDI